MRRLITPGEIVECQRRINAGEISAHGVLKECLSQGRSFTAVSDGEDPPIPLGPAKVFQLHQIIDLSASEETFGDGCLVSNGKKVKCGFEFQRVMVGLETRVPECKLRIHSLLASSTDDQIVAGIGGEAVAATTPGQMFGLMSRLNTKSREIVGFLSPTFAHVCYIRASGKLWVVPFAWSYDGYWHLEAYPFPRPSRWYAGVRVVSNKLSADTLALPNSS